MIRKHFTETSNKVELGINCVRINRAQPVYENNKKAQLLRYNKKSSINHILVVAYCLLKRTCTRYTGQVCLNQMQLNQSST